jgi:aspartyl-tRNA(Asn)/glutamyl-tRNA(Gln) amidotransferase subunit C
MKLSVAQVRHVATLARLALTPQEEEQAATQLSAILEAMETLAGVDTAGVPATGQVSFGAHSRGDVVGEHLGPIRALAGAPQRVGTSFAIPKVIE